MITASEARNKTKYNSTILEIKKEIEKTIQNAIDNGKYDCVMDIDIDTSDYIREVIRKELLKLGYQCNIPCYEQKPYNCPSDQWRYYDTIHISWAEKEE